MLTREPRKVGVLSVQLPSIGHKVFGGLLRRAFAESETIDFRPFWTDEQREPWARVVNQTLRLRLPFAWAIERNADLRRFRGELGYAFYARRLVARMRRRFPVDVLHFHTQTAALLAVDFMQQMPTVITGDQSAVQAALETERAWRWTHAPGIAVERAAVRAAAAIVSFSQWGAQSFIDDHGVDPARVHVIPVGVDLADFADIDRARRFAQTDRSLRILFVGHDFVRKGGPLLVRVFLEHFASRNVELHLVTSAPGIVTHPKIIVHRNVHAFSPEWKRLYADADIFVLPTRYEPFGIVFVEALAAGLPVIATAISAIPEIVADGQTGLLIPKDDAAALADRLEALLTNAEFRRRLGENGPQRVAALFDGAKNAERLAKLFAMVARRPGDSSGPELHLNDRGHSAVSGILRPR